MKPVSPLILCCALSMLTSPAAGQLVVRDDVNGWGWLGLLDNRRAVVQLAFGNPETQVQGRLDAQLLEELTDRGLGRIFDAGAFDAATSQVLAECTATDRTVVGSSTVTFAVHAEVSYWDHTRLAATEIYESMSLRAAPLSEFRPETYVQACSDQIADVLLRLGFEAG
ncbi:MAG TPA: hypothetical protein VLA09_06575 [Longimicrobiales bacterium]|nr:hypothetical protein [Longimicrobiales bacterium]